MPVICLDERDEVSLTHDDIHNDVGPQQSQLSLREQRVLLIKSLPPKRVDAKTQSVEATTEQPARLSDKKLGPAPQLQHVYRQELDKRTYKPSLVYKPASNEELALRQYSKASKRPDPPLFAVPEEEPDPAKLNSTVERWTTLHKESEGRRALQPLRAFLSGLISELESPALPTELYLANALLDDLEVGIREGGGDSKASRNFKAQVKHREARLQQYENRLNKEYPLPILHVARDLVQNLTQAKPKPRLSERHLFVIDAVLDAIEANINTSDVTRGLKTSLSKTLTAEKLETACDFYLRSLLPQLVKTERAKAIVLAAQYPTGLETQKLVHVNALEEHSAALLREISEYET